MNSRVCIADTRNQVDDFAVKSIEKQGYVVRRMGLPFGDFALLDNLTCAVDIKSSGGGIVEIARNICSKDHQRLKREIKKCAEWGGKICFLVANDEGIRSVDDLANWQSPTYKSGKLKGKPFTRVSGTALMKAIKTMSQPNYYAKGLTVRFSFCDKKSAGEKILKILEYWKGGND